MSRIVSHLRIGLTLCLMGGKLSHQEPLNPTMKERHEFLPSPQWNVY